jgi:aerobic C4-dicarboxylate transport protein
LQRSADADTPNVSSPVPRRAWYRHLYVQVLLAVVLGIVIGCVNPAVGKSLEPLGKGFIALVKMIIAPIIFCTVVHGIASMRDLKKLGRLGVRTLLYFEIVSTIALIIGLIVVNVIQPGVGANFAPPDPNGAAMKSIHAADEKAHALSTTAFLLNIIPSTFFGAFAQGDILQILLLALLTAFAISAMGERGAPVLHFIELASQVFFGVMRIIVALAPLGALGAMAFTVGSYGLGSLGSLGKLMGTFYLTSAVFVFLVLGAIARAAGFSIFRLLAYIKDELLLVLGTSSSETALPGMIRKMERLGCAESTVGLVIPTGYSFNLDGTNIYLTMAAIFLAQATGTPLDLKHQLTLLTVAMLSSKGAGAVTGAGFVTLAATLTAVPGIPIESLALIYGIDRFMSECRAITNLIGNGVATIVMARWEGDVGAAELRARLRDDEADVLAPDDLPAN